MANMKSFDIETSPRKTRNPYGPGGGSKAGAASVTSTARCIMICLALFVMYYLGKMIFPSHHADEYPSKGDAAGGWGSDHGHKVLSEGAARINSGGNNPVPPLSLVEPKSAWDTPASHYHDNDSVHNSAAFNGDKVDLELRETDFLAVLAPLVVIPSHSRQEYEQYQPGESEDRDTSSYGEDILYDTNTPHGMAFDYILNRDKRPLKHDDDHLVQRFVLTLLFFATGGREEKSDSAEPQQHKMGRRSSWDTNTAHFLTGLHECHWAKKTREDSLWEILSLDSDADRRVGVTKCNADMEVTEIRLADLNLVGFIPEEIKWLSSLESLDIQNNHLAGHIPDAIGELDELRYLSLDGNNFSGTIPDVFYNLVHLERAYLNFNDFNGAMAPSLCTLREDRVLEDLWSDCGGYPITCTCCTVCCDMVAVCDEMDSQKGGDSQGLVYPGDDDRTD